MTRPAVPFRIETTVEAMNDVLKRLKPAVVTRGGMLPILSSILVETVVGGTVRFTATNLDLTVRATVNMDVSLGVSKAIPYRQFKKVLDVAKKGPLVIEGYSGDNENLVGLTTGKTTVKVNVADATEYPTLPELGENPEPVNINFDLIDGILPAVSTDDNRPILTGLYVNGPTYAGTDSYRLYVTDSGVDTGTTKPILIPRAACVEFAKIGGTVSCLVSSERRNMFVTDGDYEYTTRLIEGEFPNFRALIPDTPPVLVSWNPEFVPALKELRAMTTVVGGNSAPVRISPGDEPGTIRLSIHEQDVGKVEAVVPGTCTIPVVAYNPKYLWDVVSDFDATELLGTDGLKPSVAEIIDGDIRRRRLLMPVRVA